MSGGPALIEVHIEPRNESERERLTLALSALADADGRFRFSTDAASGQIIIKGTSELHLDHKLDILKRTYNLEFYIGAPQVAYRETISRQASKDVLRSLVTRAGNVRSGIQSLRPSATSRRDEPFRPAIGMRAWRIVRATSNGPSGA
jgi:translation elongation factor EF-G